MILQGWQCVGIESQNLDGCGTIRGWGAIGIPPAKERRKAMLQCAVCHGTTQHVYVPGHLIGLEWTEFRQEHSRS